MIKISINKQTNKQAMKKKLIESEPFYRLSLFHYTPFPSMVVLLDNMHTLKFTISFLDLISYRDDYIQNTNARYITNTKTITKIKESLIAY